MQINSEQIYRIFGFAVIAISTVFLTAEVTMKSPSTLGILASIMLAVAGFGLIVMEKKTLTLRRRKR